MDTDGALAAALASPICLAASDSAAGGTITTGSRGGGAAVCAQAAANTAMPHIAINLLIRVIICLSAKLIFPRAQYPEHLEGLARAAACVQLGGGTHALDIAAQKGIHLNFQRHRRGQGSRSHCPQLLHTGAIFEPTSV